MRVLLKGLVTAAVLLLAIAGLFYYALLHTQAGAGWALSALNRQIGAGFEFGGPRGDLSSGLELTAVRFRDESVDVQAGTLRIALEVGFFPLSLRVKTLALADLRLTPTGSETEAGPLALPDSLALPLEIRFDDVSVEGFELRDPDGSGVFSLENIRLRGRAHNDVQIEQARASRPEGWITLSGSMLLQQPYTFDTELASRFESSLEEGGEPGSLEAAARLSGKPDQYQLEAAGWVALPEWDRHDFQLQSEGSLQGLLVSSLLVEGPALQLETRAELDWLSQLIALSGFQAGMPGSPLRASGDLRLDLGSGKLDGAVGWSDFAWPLTGEADITSRSGAVTLTGNMDDWNVQGDAELERAGIPPGTLAFSASGDRDHADVRITRGNVLGGELAGNLQWNWSAGGVLSAVLQARRIDTTALYPGRPAVLDAELVAEGALEPLDLEISVRSLSLSAADREIQAAGNVHLLPGTAVFEDVVLQSASSRVTLNGDPADPRGVSFAARIADLGDFLPDSSGSLEGQGVVGLLPGRQVLSLDFQGRDFAWGSVRVPEWALTGSGRGAEESVAVLSLVMAGPTIGGQLFDDVRLLLDLGRERQSLELLSSVTAYQLEAAVEGRWLNPGQALNEAQWSGRLERLVVSEQGNALVGLRNPAALAVSLHSAELEPACLDGSDGFKLCLDAAWQERATLSMNAELDALPLDGVRRLAGLDIAFNQLVSGRVGVSIDAGGPSGEAAIRFSPGQVKLADVDETLFETDEGFLGFRLREGRLSAGQFDVPIRGQGAIDVDFSLGDITAGADSSLDGSVKVGLADLDILSIFIPIADELTGRLESDIRLAGTAGNPRLSGHLALADGKISNAVSGLTLSDINLAGSIDGTQKTHLNGSFRAMEGVGTLTAGLDFSNILSPRLDLAVQGDNLTVFNSNTLKMKVDPDVQLTWQNGVLDIGGRLFIPSALIAPRVIPAATISESEDAVIVAGEIAGAPVTREAEQPLVINGDLQVELGNDVRIDFSVIRASGTGVVDFQWNGDMVPNARGNYVLVGQFQAFGQLLEITEANIGFPNVTALNPHLNIRAERQIFGNSEIRRAGVFVTGTLRRPVIEPYTDPMTNRDRARTLLVTGSDFNMERGVGAVGFGTYIAPRIFVNYGIGVFEDENVISIRYDLGRNWGIKATSGERQTGIDISYTLER